MSPALTPDEGCSGLWWALTMTYRIALANPKHSFASESIILYHYLSPKLLEYHDLPLDSRLPSVKKRGGSWRKRIKSSPPESTSFIANRVPPPQFIVFRPMRCSQTKRNEPQANTRAGEEGVQQQKVVARGELLIAE